LTGSSVAISNEAAIPIVAKRSAESRVAVKNGETIVIGGLMEDRKTESVSKFPILGDIPVLGHAFRRTQKSKVKTELLIFLTPHVAASPSVLKGMSQEEIDGTRLVPYSDPKVYQEHMEGLQRGGKTSSTQPTSKPTGLIDIGPLPSRETGDKTITPDSPVLVPVPVPVDPNEGR
jgi:type II secretory pathway component GspD/PulD (secretin)